MNDAITVLETRIRELRERLLIARATCKHSWANYEADRTGVQAIETAIMEEERALDNLLEDEHG